jgi:large subunit ribosomal protein L15
MPHDLRKIRKLRGRRTAGWGRVAQHRRSSRKGGRGMAGGAGTKFTLFLAQGGPTRGFIPKPIRKPVEAVNLTQLERLAASSAVEAGNATIDLSSMGVGKLLGGGVAPKNVEIVVSSWSKRAEEKVKAAGGSIRKP